MELKIKNLSFSYEKGKKTVDNASFTAKQGKSLFILGANGAGKSTLIKLVCGLLKPESGTIEFDGKNLLTTKPKERAKLISTVPQEVWFPETTVFDAVLLGRRPYIKSGTKETDLIAVRDALRLLDMEDFALKNVKNISGGEKQKTAVARAIAQSTPIMIFDELTSNLDVKNQHETLVMLKKITEEKRLISVTIVHDINLALNFADEILLMKNGKTVKQVSVEEITESDINDVFEIRAKIIDCAGKKAVVFGG